MDRYLNGSYWLAEAGSALAVAVSFMNVLPKILLILAGLWYIANLFDWYTQRAVRARAKVEAAALIADAKLEAARLLANAAMEKEHA